ncbi:hypothetical protein [Streptomyces erythrochromogenes]|uniref:hypothetical protein n=1 Tax=Streptomyces erythrochromogenes TaxID=285574 RepID=UPI002252B0E1|nr:hypothetical protein [Streptomyces erythrochromogenes]MCX5584226.1 hypothetical protein [Streptomyces erythrochromogenes]
MTTYQLEFGRLGETYPVPPLTVTAANRHELARRVEEHASPFLAPVLAELGRPELADCLFRTDRNATCGEFMWLDLAGGVGASFCAARIRVI